MEIKMKGRMIIALSFVGALTIGPGAQAEEQFQKLTGSLSHGSVKCQSLMNSGNMLKRRCVGHANPKPRMTEHFIRGKTNPGD